MNSAQSLHSTLVKASADQLNAAGTLDSDGCVPFPSMLSGFSLLATTAKDLVNSISGAVNWTAQESDSNPLPGELVEAIKYLANDADRHAALLRGCGSKCRDFERLSKDLRGDALVRELELSLQDVTHLLSQEEVTSPQSQSLYGFVKTLNGSSLDPAQVKEMTERVNACRRRCDRAFKAFWSFFSFFQQKPMPPNTFRDSKMQDTPLWNILKGIHYFFQEHPFQLLPDNLQGNLMELNRDNDSASEHERVIRNIAMQWSEREINAITINNMDKPRTSQIRDLRNVQLQLFELLWSKYMEELRSQIPKAGSTLPSQADNEDHISILDSDLDEMGAGLLDLIVRTKQPRTSIAICGMTKAGKSLFLNTIIGLPLLPSDELPATAWPCRVRHVSGLIIPKLEFDNKPFLSGIVSLQQHKFGQRLASYKPPEHNGDCYDLIDSDSVYSDSADKPDEMADLYLKWADLHRLTKANLEKFETFGFVLPSGATGIVEITELLVQLNDIIRLCSRFGLPLSFNYEVEWPLITVEFASLKNSVIDGEYEFIDLPGLGEGVESFAFENIARLVTKDASMVIPVVSYKELPRSDWRMLPSVISNGFGREAGLVVCTHLDEIERENIETYHATVHKAFWTQPQAISSSLGDILPCSPLIGNGAQSLLELSRICKPPMNEFWDQPTRSPIRICAASILGTGRPQENYSSMSFGDWVSCIKRQYQASGMPSAVKRLSQDLVKEVQQHGYLAESDGIRRKLAGMIKEQSRLLKNARSDPAVLKNERKGLQRTMKKYKALLDSWERLESEQIEKYLATLKKVDAVFRKRCEGHIHTCIRSTVEAGVVRVVKGLSGQQRSTNYRNPRTDMGESSVLVAESTEEAERFIQKSQETLRLLLSKESNDYVKKIRTVMEKARNERSKSLIGIIDRQETNTPVELLENIKYNVDEQLSTVQQLVLNQMKSKVEMKKSRVSLRDIYRSVDRKLATWSLTRGHPDGELQNLSEREGAMLKTIDEFGFAARAPKAVLKTLSLAITASLWVFQNPKLMYHLAEDRLAKTYRDDVVQPWLGSLAKESEKSLQETIKAASRVGRTAVEDALANETKRYQEERLQEKNIRHAIALISNLWAIDSALVTIRNEMMKLLAESSREQ